MLRSNQRFITVGSLLALVVGIGLGVLAHAEWGQWLSPVAEVLSPVGELWVRALRMIILPLVVSYLTVAVLDSAGRRYVGRMSVVAATSFVVLLGLGAVYSLLLSPVLASHIAVTDAVRAALGATSVPTPKPEPAPGLGEWLVGLIPANPIAAAARDDILGIVVVTIVFAIAFSRIDAPHRELVTKLAHAVREATLVIMGWLLATMPIAVFAIAFSVAARTGAELGGALVGFIAAACALLTGAIAGVYVLAVAAGRARPGPFARSLSRAQMIAAGTRSSLATLPALMEGAERELDLPSPAVGLVLPLSVSVFKMNRPITGILNVIFLTHLYGIPLSPQLLVVFAGTEVITSFGSPGIPSGGQFLMLPFYLAAGIPVEGVVLLKAVDAIPDVFKTILNVTADMAVAVFATRFGGDLVAGEPSASSTGSGVAA